MNKTNIVDSNWKIAMHIVKDLLHLHLVIG